MANFNDFVNIVDLHLKGLCKIDSAEGSVDYCLRNHLSKLSHNCHSSISAREVTNSVKALTRFSADSIDWNSPLLKVVIEIVDFHKGLIQSDSGKAL